MANPLPPALPGLPLIGNAFSFFRDPVKLFQRGYEHCGPIFSICLGRKPAVVLVGPEYQEFFFTETDNALTMREVYEFVIPMFGEVTLAAKPAEYAEQRAIIKPAFHGEKMGRYIEQMIRETEKWLHSLDVSGAFELWSSCEQLSMYIAAGALMGTEFRERMGSRFWSLYRDVAGGMEFILPSNLPIPRFRRRDRAKRQLLEMLRPVIAERRKTPDRHDDFLQLLAEAKYSDGRPVSDETIMGMILILVFAAYDTTAAQTSWALIQLLQHPQYLQRVRREQTDILEDRADTINGRSLARLTHLEWALKETARMHPITTMLWRYTARSYELGGYRIPEGWITMVCPPVAQRLPDVFPSPHRYEPERFSKNRHAASRHPFSLINFGGGFHKCLGMHFAYNEMKVILSLLLQRYTLELQEAEPRPDYSTGITRPKSPYHVSYRKRC